MNFTHELNRIYLKNEADEVTAHVDFPEEREGVVDVCHTIVDPSLQGQGIAGKLMEELTAQLREDGRKAVLSCSYAIRWFAKHPECADVLANPEKENEKAKHTGKGTCPVRLG